MQLSAVCNNYFDTRIRPQLQLGQLTLSAFQVCSYIGLSLAVIFAVCLSVITGLSPWVIIAIAFTSVATFLNLAMITKIIIGKETLIYYHQFIAVITTNSALLWLLKQPIFPYIDITILSIGICVACGRIGCLMVGCCHGKPHKFGICYQTEHAAAGFTPYYVGLRLFPIQLLESLWVFLTVFVGTIVLLNNYNYEPGDILNWYLIVYAVGRFCFEFGRGDAGRFYFWGFSEAQWTSLILVFIISFLEILKIINFHLWHQIILICIVSAMTVIAIRRKLYISQSYNLLNPNHVQEIAEALNISDKLTITSANISNILVNCTSMGIQISTSMIKNEKGVIYYYTISSKKEKITEETAKKIADLILKLKKFDGNSELIHRENNVFHLLTFP